MPASVRKNLRIGIAGAGMISRHHLIGWSRTPCAEVVAICDPDQDRAAKRAAEFEIPRVYANASEMLAGEKLDAMDVASPRETHAEIVRLCAANHVHAFCQKPLAPTLAEAENLVRDVAGKIRLMVHENWRFRPYYRKIKEWIDEGKIGAINSCHLVYRSSGFLADTDGRRPAFDRQPFMQHEQYLMIREVLIHHLDVVRWLIGPLKLVGAFAARTLPEVKGETVATIVMRTIQNMPVIVEGNLAAPGLPPRTHDRFELFGDRASVMLLDNRLDLRGDFSETITYDLDAAYQKSFNDAVLHFCESLIAGSEFETSAAENLATLRLVEEAESAARLR